MRPVKTLLLVCLAVTTPLAQTSDLLLSDKRLTVNTLLREDAYDNYTLLWQQQGATIEKLPVHFKVECSQGSRSRRSEPDGPRKPRSISTRC